jgi:hypothetical protein
MTLVDFKLWESQPLGFHSHVSPEEYYHRIDGSYTTSSNDQGISILWASRVMQTLPSLSYELPSSKIHGSPPHACLDPTV